MNRVFLTAAAIVCLASAGCRSTTSNDTDSIRVKQSKEVRDNKRKIDNYIKSYIQPEHEIPAVYAQEWQNNPDYKKIAALTEQTYKSLAIFAQANKFKSVSLTYATADVKKSFIFSASKEKNKIAILCRDEDKVQEIFRAEAEMPEITVMPKNIPANMEDAVIRELHMIHSFLHEPRKLAKSVSLDVIPMMNVVKKTTEYERKEYDINGRLCCKLEVQLRDMFGAGMFRLYVEGQDIVRIEIPSLTLDAGANATFILAIDSYKNIDGIRVPSSFTFRGERFLLKENKIGR